jgi:hypothetical protein
VHVTFSLTPPKNITNFFGNWLQGIAENKVKQLWVGVCAILWALWNLQNDFVFKKTSAHPCVVLSPTSGAAGGHGFWVQPLGDGCSGFIQPIRLAV